MGSLEDAIDEEPERFIDYLDVQAIINSKNPYKKFKEELRKAFGSTKTGLNIWKHLKDSFNLQNKLFKTPRLQSQLPEKFKGSYKKKEFNRLKKQFNKPNKRLRSTGIYAVNKTVAAISHNRKIKITISSGKTINAVKRIASYLRSRPRLFKPNQIDFLSRRLNEKPYNTVRLFNKTFRTNRTYSSIKTKLSRLRSKKNNIFPLPKGRGI